MNPYQKRYLAVWRRAFPVILGWTEEKVIVWAQHLLRQMDPPGMVINKSPLYYVAREIADQRDAFIKLNAGDCTDLLWKLEQSMEVKGAPDSCPSVHGLKKAKIKINKILLAFKV